MSYFHCTKTLKAIQIRGTREEQGRVMEKRIYHQRPRKPEDPEFVIFRNYYYAVHHDADGDYISTDEPTHGQGPVRLNTGIRVPQPRVLPSAKK